MTELISPTLAAAQSTAIDVHMKRKGTAGSAASGDFPMGSTFRVTGGALAAGEYVKLQYNDGTDWRDATIGGTPNILDDDNAVATVYGRMTGVRVSKSITAAAIGVEVV